MEFVELPCDVLYGDVERVGGMHRSINSGAVNGRHRVYILAALHLFSGRDPAVHQPKAVEPLADSFVGREQQHFVVEVSRQSQESVGLGSCNMPQQLPVLLQGLPAE
eukprot:GHUV01049066.1.p1 GENE.GHUV01049066.1~~GHUV01049066.1.p1  ORF type:complete len:107 (-),score=26.63 GHUV01049066.1:353-673(-)